MDKFFELITKLKELGIAAKLCSSSSADTLREEWNKFLSENSDLVEEIKAWGAGYEEGHTDYIFAEGAEIENPEEVAIIICVCADTTNVSESEICEHCADLETALEDTGEKVAMAVAGISSNGYYISEINAEEIFNYIQENLAEEDADTEESESEEDSDDGEDTTAEDTAQIADADTNYDV